ncbi:MAG: SDR family NAD(P)-dependent oxidoreductase, partial [Rhodospirillales bacterium]|nr:SDR family NAD(P)-dependent oxidoreductase [Rhodospirillales bacterium]MCW9002107.1 SDR family NAD(P)-dependent oxidoreductase [Rhodospirillales bacterium]
MTDQPKRFFCFGLGYSASVLARQLLAAGWRVGGTCQDEARAAALRAEGIEAVVFDGKSPMDDAPAVLRGATHLLVSIPPGPDGDPVLRWHGVDIAATDGLEWIGYLSTTGV